MEEESSWKTEDVFQSLRLQFEERFKAELPEATVVRHGGTRLVEHVNIAGLPRLGGSYHASVGNGYIHCSAVVGVELLQEDDISGQAPELVKGGIRAETYRCCQLIEQVLRGCSARWADLVRLTAFVAGLEDAKVEAFEEALDHFCGEHGCPQAARTVVGCARLRLQATVQIEAIACSSLMTGAEADSASCPMYPLDVFPVITSAAGPSVVPPISPPPGLRKAEADVLESRRTSCATTAGSTPNLPVRPVPDTPSNGPSPELGPVRAPGLDARNAQTRNLVEASGEQPFSSLNLAPGTSTRGSRGAHTEAGAFPPGTDSEGGEAWERSAGSDCAALSAAASGAAGSFQSLLNLEAILHAPGQEDESVGPGRSPEENLSIAAAAPSVEATPSRDMAKLEVKAAKTKKKVRGKQQEVTPLNPSACRFLPTPPPTPPLGSGTAVVAGGGTAVDSLLASSATSLAAISEAASANLLPSTAEPSFSSRMEAPGQALDASRSCSLPTEKDQPLKEEITWAMRAAAAIAAPPAGKRGKAKAKAKAPAAKPEKPRAVEQNGLPITAEATSEKAEKPVPVASSQANLEVASVRRSPLVGQLACLCLEEVPGDEGGLQINGDLQMNRWRARMTGHDVYRTVRLGPGQLLCAQLEHSWARAARGPWPVVWSYNFDIVISKTSNSFVNIGFVEWIANKEREVPEFLLQDQRREVSLAELMGISPGDDWTSEPTWQHLSENPRQMMLGCRKGVKWYGNNFSEPLFKNDICEGTQLHFQCDNIFDQSGKLKQVQMWLLPSTVHFRARSQTVQLAKPIFEWPSPMLWEDWKSQQDAREKCAMWVPAVTMFSKDDSVIFNWRGARSPSFRDATSIHAVNEKTLVEPGAETVAQLAAAHLAKTPEPLFAAAVPPAAAIEPPWRAQARRKPNLARNE